MVRLSPVSHPYLRLAGILLAGVLLLTACGGGDGGKESARTNSTPYYDEAAIIEESRSVQSEIVAAINSGDAAVLLGLLEKNVAEQIGGELDPASPEMRALGQALAAARPVRAYPGLVFYETAYGDETLSFYIIQEEGTWKLGGL